MIKILNRLVLGLGFLVGAVVLFGYAPSAKASDGNFGFNVTHSKYSIAWNYIDASTVTVQQGEWVSLKLNTIWNLSSGCWPGASEPMCTPTYPLGQANVTVTWRQDNCPSGLTCYWFSRSGPMDLTYGIVANYTYSPTIQISGTGNLSPGTYPMTFSIEEHPNACQQSGGTCMEKKNFTVNLVILGPPPQPAISAQPSNLTFLGISGNPAPAASTITLKNTGNATLNWNAGLNQSWCHLSSTAGSLAPSATSVLNVWVDAPTNVGSFTCVVTFSDPNSSNGNQTVSITYNVSSAPVLKPAISALPLQINFGAISGNPAPAASTITLKNTGNATLNWNAGLNQSWCHLSSTAGSLAPSATSVLNVWVDAPTNVGSFTCVVTFSDPNSSNGNQTVNVVYSVSAPTPKPAISLQPGSLSFSASFGGQAPASQTLTIQNTGNATLNWSGTTNQAWCHLSGYGGNVAPGASQSIAVSMDAPFGAGTYNCNINIGDPNSSNGSQNVGVTYDISYNPPPPPTQPIIVAQPGGLNFSATSGGSSPASQSITVRNTGTGTLNWTASLDKNWCHISAMSGSVIVGGSSVLNTWVDSPTNVGSFTCIVTFSDPNASNSSQPVIINYNVAAVPPPAQPAISVSPPNTYFNASQGGGAPSGSTVRVSNIGNATLNWTASLSQSWCHLSTLSGSLAAGAGADLNLWVDAPTNIGTFTCMVTFSDPNSSNGNPTINAIYSVDGTPVTNPNSPVITSISPNQATLAQVQGQITMDVFGSKFDSVLSNNLALFTRNADGQTTGATVISFVPGGLRIYVPANFIVGNYSIQILNGRDFLNLRSNKLTFQVVPNSLMADMFLSPSSMVFDAISGGNIPSGQGLVIRNTGSANLKWTVATDQSWCHVGPASGTTLPGNTATVTVTMGTPSNVGSFSCHITVTGENSVHPQQSIYVTYNVSTSPIEASCNFTNETFRYLRYENIYPVAWAAWKELEFYDTSGNKLSPTIAGGSADWTYPTQGAYGKRAAIDGDIYTQWNGADVGWVTPFSPPIEIILDFGQPVNLGRMRFLPQNTTARDVNIWVGNDAGSTTKLLKKIQGNYFEAVWIDFNCLAGNAVLSVNPNAMSFNSKVGNPAPAGQVLNIYNTGANTLTWTASANQNWCHISPTTGSLSGGGSTTALVRVDAPSNVGSFNCLVVISSPASVSKSVDITYAVEQATPANIVLSPTSFNFAAVSGQPTPPSQTLTIKNTGVGALNWYASPNQGWCHIQPASGMVSPGSNTVTTVFVDLPSNIGSFSCTITVSGPNTASGPQEAIVSYNVTPPLSATMVLSGNTFTFNGVINGSAPAGQTLTIRNSGKAALNWSAQANQTWCKAQPASGSLLPGASANTTLTVNAPFGAGTFSCVLSVSAPNTTNSPQSANIAYLVSGTPKPIISVSPNSFPFQASVGGTAPSVQTMTLKNAGNATLNWTAAVNQPWCHLSSIIGNLSQGASVNILVSVDRPSNIGVFNCSVTVSEISNPNNYQQVPVTYRVDTAGVSNPAQVLAASPACGVITVSWQAGRNATAYALYKSTVNTMPASAYQNSLTDLSFVDANVVQGTKYFYWVQSIGSTGGTPAEGNIFQGTAPSACEADLTPSDKNLKAINGITQPHDDCDYNKFQGAPQGKTLKDGDILTFDINLCNLTGTADATNVKITDRLLNLSMPVKGFNVMVDGKPFRLVSGAPQIGEYSYDPALYELIFNVGSVSKISAKQITYDALVKTQNANFTGCVKCQSQTVISFKKDAAQPLQEVDLYTPPIFYSVSKP